MLTKSVKYTHQLAHWVNAVRTGDPGEVVSSSYYSHLLADERPSQEDLINRLKIISYRDFSIDDPCNLAYRMYAALM